MPTMTFNWTEAQVPPLVLAPGRPGARKISATSRADVHVRLRCGGRAPTDNHLRKDLGAHLGIERRGLEPMARGP